MRQRKNLTGQKYNRLTPINDAGYASFGSRVWKCLCDCGNYIDVSVNRLQSGNTKSCGCYRKDMFAQRTLEESKALIGKKYNKLTVIKDMGYDSSTQERDSHKFLCLCDCGNYTNISIDSLINSRTKSCGCLAKEIITKRNIANSTIQIGNRYGKLTVIQHLGYRSDNRGKNNAWYLCKCDCGNQKETMGNRLQSGFSLSCGCLSSYGESEIERILKGQAIKYSVQKTFDGLRSQETNTALRFDFCIYNDDETINCLIEYDGRSHRTGPEGNWTKSASFEVIQSRDKMKNDFCLQNNILLYRIPSNEITNFTLSEIFNDKFLVKGKEEEKNGK